MSPETKTGTAQPAFPASLPEHLAESSQVTACDVKLARAWYDAALAAARGGDAATWFEDWLGCGLPFGFKYGDMDASAVLNGMQRTEDGPREIAGGERRTITWQEAGGGLQITWELRAYGDYPAVEWFLWFENVGKADLASLESVEALVLRTRHAHPEQPSYVHGAYGGGCRTHDMWPFMRTVGDPGSAPVVLSSPDEPFLGGPTSDYLPFFNLETPDGHGVLGGIGMAGEWMATFSGHKTEVEARVGFRPRQFVLHPGERLRAHHILLVFWEGKRLHGHNMLRRLLLEHHVPQVNGKTREPLVTTNVAFAYNGKGGWLEQVTEDQVMPLVEPYARMGVEEMMIDAGWYPTDGKSWWDGIGSWDVAPEKFPNGFGPLAARLAEAKIKLGVWFASEMIAGDKQILREHPEWVETRPNGVHALRMELPAAREWFLGKVDEIIKQGAALYRQDGGLRRDNPAHSVGLLEMFDEMVRRHPGLLMEGCCGGGRNICLDTMARFHWHQKSDRWGYTEEDQAGLYGANLYLPGGSILVFTYAPDAYTMWSSFAGQLCLSYPDPLAPDFPIKEAARNVALYKQVRHLLEGDFYPLTSCGVDEWIGYQFHRPDIDAGMALIFRRPTVASVVPENGRFMAPLRGLTPDRLYHVKQIAGHTDGDLPGSVLRAGLGVPVSRRGAELVLYQPA